MQWGMIAAGLAAAWAASASAQVTYTAQAPPIVVLHPQADPAEKIAADELALHLGQILGAPIKPVASADPPARAIVVGLARRWGLAGSLGEEAVRMQTRDGRIYLLGGGPRGAIYAVNRFLHRQGVRWWTPWAATVPKRSRLVVPSLDETEEPAFESRDPFWFHAFDREWARRNGSNSMHARLTADDGGKIGYSGFVHTFYPLVPPEEHFERHPEWFSLVDGTRRKSGAQLCATNPELRAFLVGQVRSRLRSDPQARIISVSQNDWYGACTCPACKALDDAEGTHAATVLDLANHVADAIKEEFPLVAVDTLAYQYTRKAPKTMRPRPNVIVRLCSIECDFSKPLDHPANAAFAKDLTEWSRLTNRLYVWNYGTCFPNYIMPFPNWDVVGPNQRFFSEHGVKGLFEQGAYQSSGGAMAEMNAWVQAQLLWNPRQNDRALRAEFLRGYYGKAAPHIQKAMDLLAKEAAQHPMTIWAGPGAPFFNARTVIGAEGHWERAARAVAANPDLAWRVSISRLGNWFVALNAWSSLQREADRRGLKWPFPASRRALADRWMETAFAPGPKGWTPITHMSEAGLKPKDWVARFAADPPPPESTPRSAAAKLPSDLVVPAGSRVVSVQDDQARLFLEGDLCLLRPDPKASDGVACHMPGSHREWAFQLPVPKSVQSGVWDVYVVVRVDAGASPSARAFSAGIWDSSGRSLGDASGSNQEFGSGYRTLKIARASLPASAYVWAAPAEGGSKGVWVDRVLFVSAGG